jgi:hypothetical protein
MSRVHWIREQLYRCPHHDEQPDEAVAHLQRGVAVEVRVVPVRAAHVVAHDGVAVLVGPAGRHRGVAAQLDPFESKGLKPVFHFIGSRVETRRLSRTRRLMSRVAVEVASKI